MEEIDKAKGILIDLLDGRAYFQRYAPDTPSGDPLTDQEKVILFLDSRYEKLKLQLEEKRIKEKIRCINEDLLDNGVDYIHEKSGKLYTALENPVINKTTGDSDNMIMIYYRNEEGETFVRERSEFEAKFKKV